MISVTSISISRWYSTSTKAQKKTYLQTPRSRVVLEKPSANQEISRILWSRKVHYRFHKSSPPVPILSQIIPAYVLPTFFLKIHFNIVFPSVSWSSKRFVSFRFPHQTPYVYLFSLCLLSSAAVIFNFKSDLVMSSWAGTRDDKNFLVWMHSCASLAVFGW